MSIRGIALALTLALGLCAAAARAEEPAGGAAGQAKLEVLLDTIRAAQAGYYVRLVKDNSSLEQFINGWLNRARA